MRDGTHLEAYKEKLAKVNGAFKVGMETVLDDILEGEEGDSIDEQMEDFF